ncbi:NrsF family protein [Brevundimonas vancanneytii]|uniref:Protein of uncharacterized function (DUF1109) n=1 Tax=Brevundimonas vancanneytii TaxID=1325724 RepID=A0A4P1K9B5_9CAUL|nr:DUF1109 domain-containing protein [Brevundimonas vancanneytii]VTO17017.1 Protein of uncharacterised function (DUF1109) [Brevundimonas vancanneytii]
MKTDDLIDALAFGLEPVKPARASSLLLAAAVVASVVGVVVLLGVRPDLIQAMGGLTPWLKGLYTLALAAAALRLTTRLGRPGADVRPAAMLLFAVVAVATTAGAIELALTTPDQRMAVWLGRTWDVCGRNILLISAVTAPFVYLSARRLAPTRPSAGGAALGVMTGAVAATAYGLLHCPEATVAFVATWYTLGVAAVGAIGALIGRFALRW